MIIVTPNPAALSLHEVWQYDVLWLNGQTSSGHFCYNGLTLILAWISNHTSSKMWDEITYPLDK